MVEKNKTLFKDNIGVVVKIYAGVDISDATSIIMRVRKPSGTKQAWTGTLVADNTFYAYHTTIAGDLNEVGEYLVSLEITATGGTTIYGQSDTFTVFDQFYDLDPPNRYLNIY